MKKYLATLFLLITSLCTLAQEPEEPSECIKKSIDGFIEYFPYFPLAILLIATIVLARRLAGYDLKKALSSGDDSNTPSTSRLVVFISGISAIIFSFCLFTFYTSIYIKTGCAPEIEELSNSLIALGIGIIPYSINKVAGAIYRR